MRATTEFDWLPQKDQMVILNSLLNVVKCGLRKIRLILNSCYLVSLYSATALGVFTKVTPKIKSLSNYTLIQAV